MSASHQRAARIMSLAGENVSLNAPARWKKIVGQRVYRLSVGEARVIFDAIISRNRTDEQPEIRMLTGGYSSQYINAYVIEKLVAKIGRNPSD
jgi:hypothetical protein